MPPASFALQARYVFPVDQPPIPDGIVVIDAGRIVAVGTARPDVEVEDLGNVAILPGFVNPHTHLEFSDLEQPLGQPGMPFPAWIRAVIAHRGSLAGNSDQAIRKGLAESITAGVTTLGEIATSDAWHAASDTNAAEMVIFRELLGLKSDRKDALTQVAQAHCEQLPTALASEPDGTARQYLGLSPHAPYTVHPRVLQRAMRLSRERRFPIAMHLAESREEVQLLQSQDGPFLDLLRDLNAWEPEAIPAGTRPLDYLAMLAPAFRSLVIHGNYLDDEEMFFLASRAERMSLIYCPRTHAYFQHAPYPLARLLEMGISVAVGTDSRATNPDLSLLAELRFVAARHPSIPLDDVLALGTLDAARALGVDAWVGSLSPGKWANLAVVALPDSEARDPHELLLHSSGPVVATYFRGAKVT